MAYKLGEDPILGKCIPNGTIREKGSRAASKIPVELGHKIFYRTNSVATRQTCNVDHESVSSPSRYVYCQIYLRHC